MSEEKKWGIWEVREESSRGEKLKLIFQHHLWGKVIQERELFRRGVIFFQCHLSAFYKTKSRSNRCKTKIFRSKDETFCARDDLPGPGSYLREGVIFRCRCREGGGGGVFKGEVIQGQFFGQVLSFWEIDAIERKEKNGRIFGYCTVPVFWK